MVSRYKSSGWFGESLRHSLSAKKIKTSQKLADLGFSMSRIDFAKGFSDDITQIVADAQKEALGSRKERIGFSKDIPLDRFGIPLIEPKNPLFPVKKEKQEKLADFDIKEEIRDMLKLSGKVTTSDLQGIAEAKARKIIGNLDMKDRDNRLILFEAQDIILHYACGEMDLNTAKRYLLDIKEKASKAKKIDYQSDVTYSPVTVQTKPVIITEQLEKKPAVVYSEEHLADMTYDEIQALPEHEKKRLVEKGWLTRGLQAEGKVLKSVGRGAGKVAKGFLSTVAEGLAWNPEGEEESFHYRRPLYFARKNK